MSQQRATGTTRDARDVARAADAGWDTLVIWECQARDPLTLSDRLAEFVGPERL
jgi:G:T-mismatch repair DNA endonuclease (very short patch repair protein)